MVEPIMAAQPTDVNMRHAGEASKADDESIGVAFNSTGDLVAICGERAISVFWDL